MSFPEPVPGLVLRYAYLWRAEAERGRDEAIKDRPCVVVVAVRRLDERIRVYVAPITHSRPQGGTSALELPHTTKRRLGLDDEPSWIVTDEVNSFLWSGPDIRFIVDRQKDKGIAYGYLPHALTERMLSAFREQVRSKRAATVNRDEGSR